MMLPLTISAQNELRAWSGHTEDDAWGKTRIADYWRAAGLAFPGPAIPWSAVFVSFLANIYAPGALERTASHIKYVRSARLRKLENKPGYWAFDPRTTTPEIGDIVVRSRGLTRTTWDDVENGVGGFRETHGDIVVGRSEHAVRAIGGNAGSNANPQGVQSREYPIDSAGMLIGDRWVAVLRLSDVDQDRTPVEGAGPGPAIPLYSPSSVRSGLEHIRGVVNRLLLTL